jgi:hypothetical protein
MKTAVYLDEGNTQLVITADNDWERNILKMIHNSLPASTYWGEFYACRGGWIRQTEDYYDKAKDSLIMRVQPGKPLEDLTKG